MIKHRFPPARPRVRSFTSKKKGSVFAFVRPRLPSLLRVIAASRHGPREAPTFNLRGDLGPALHIPLYRKGALPVPFIRPKGTTMTYHLWLVLVTKEGRLKVVGKPGAKAKPVFEAVVHALPRPGAGQAEDMTRLHAELVAASKEEITAGDGFKGKLARLRQAQYADPHATLLADEAMAHLCAKALKNFNDVQALRRKLKNHHKTQGTLETFRAFFDDLDAKMAPRALGPHSYSMPLKSVDQAGVMQGLAHILAAIEAKGYPVFINSGTLLGFHRDGKMIAHDDDVDFAVYYGEGDAKTVARRQLELFQALRQEVPIEFKALGAFLGFHLPDHPGVDLFPAWSDGGRFYVYPYLHGDLSSEDVLPLASHDWLSTSIKTPRNIEAVLVQNYGQGWAKPDPGWRFDWTRSRRRFETYLSAAERAKSKAKEET